VDSKSASVVHPAATRQSVPRAVRHSATASASRKRPTNSWRHQVGTPLSPTRRAVSDGTLWVATSCCCSLTALRKPSACAPKPTSPTVASTKRLSAALPATARRSRAWRGASTRKGSITPAVTLIATPATMTPAAPRKRGLLPAVSISAAASSRRISVSLWAPPTASSSSTGLSPTKAAAQRREWPHLPAARAISATAPRLETTATALKAHSPPASPRGAVA
jgi:hypothetical protein